MSEYFGEISLSNLQYLINIEDLNNKDYSEKNFEFEIALDKLKCLNNEKFEKL